jgi:hypothetical protein
VRIGLSGASHARVEEGYKKERNDCAPSENAARQNAGVTHQDRPERWKCDGTSDKEQFPMANHISPASRMMTGMAYEAVSHKRGERGGDAKDEELN